MITPWSAFYRRALARPHTAYSRVEVWRSGSQIDELAQYDPDRSGSKVFLSGSIRATWTSRVARSLTMTIPESLYPYRPTDLLNPYGDELRCFRGIRYGDGGRDEFPIFRGPITSVAPQGGGAASVRAADLALDVIAAGFSAPQRAAVGAGLVDEFERLVSDALPDAQYGAHDSFTEVVPDLSYDTDRGAALDGLAKVAGALWYPLAGGAFVLRHIPWTVPITTDPILMGSGGPEDAGGTVVSAYPERSRDGVYSRVTVTSERTDGSVPVYATAEDTDPNSPTYISGPFGVKSATVRVTQATNQGQALSAAKVLLRRARGLTESWRITCVPDASLELGDAIDLRYRGVRTRQIIAGYALPLDAGGVMSIEGRDLVLAGLEDS